MILLAFSALFNNVYAVSSALATCPKGKGEDKLCCIISVTCFDLRPWRQWRFYTVAAQFMNFLSTCPVQSKTRCLMYRYICVHTVSQNIVYPCLFRSSLGLWTKTKWTG